MIAAENGDRPSTTAFALESLPEHNRQKWEKEGISARAAEAEQQARTSLRARLTRRPERHVEAAVRQECGADAQRLDKAMREEMQQDRRWWEVLGRMDTLQYEENQVENERIAKEVFERSRTREMKSEPERQGLRTPRVPTPDRKGVFGQRGAVA